jgi:hypothetical protein
VLKLVVRGQAERWADYARAIGVGEVVQGALPWYAMAQYKLEQLPALICECDKHPYEVLGVWYREDISAVAHDPPHCEHRGLSKEVLAKAHWLHAMPRAPEGCWLPGMGFAEGRHQPRCGRCATALKTNADGSLAEYRCPWCGLTAFVDADGLPHCMLCGRALRVERDGAKEQALCPNCCVCYVRATADRWEGCYIEIIKKGGKPD